MIEETVKIDEFTCRIIRSNNVSNTPVVFLHGYVFTSEVWREINVLDFLEKRGIPFIAIDMPYGLKSKCNPKTKDPNSNVNLVKKIIGDFEPIIVGASLGGYIALKYSLKNNVKGLLLIAPVRCFEEDLMESYKNFKVTTYIIYGENDKIVSLDNMKKLSKLLNAKLIIYNNADHPAYLNNPSKFKEDLLELYKSVTD